MRAAVFSITYKIKAQICMLWVTDLQASQQVSTPIHLQLLAGKTLVRFKNWDNIHLKHQVKGLV